MESVSGLITVRSKETERVVLVTVGELTKMRWRSEKTIKKRRVMRENRKKMKKWLIASNRMILKILVKKRVPPR